MQANAGVLRAGWVWMGTVENVSPGLSASKCQRMSTDVNGCQRFSGLECQKMQAFCGPKCNAQSCKKYAQKPTTWLHRPKSRARVLAYGPNRG